MLEASDNDDLRYAAQQAIFSVFDIDQYANDKYCLNERFNRVTNSRFVKLEDFKIESSKLVSPQKLAAEK